MHVSIHPIQAEKNGNHHVHSSGKDNPSDSIGESGVPAQSTPECEIAAAVVSLKLICVFKSIVSGAVGMRSPDELALGATPPKVSNDELDVIKSENRSQDLPRIKRRKETTE